MPAKFSSGESAARRAEILQAAAQVFAAKGYEKTTVRDLEEATGLTRGGIFFHFPGKRPLYLAMLRKILLEEPLVERQAIIEAGMREAGSAEDALMQAYRNILDWHAAHPEAMQLFEQIHLQRDDPAVAALDEEIGGSLDAFITGIARRLQELRIFNPALESAAVASLMHGMLDHLTAAASEMPRGEAEAMASTLFRVVAQGLEPRDG
jgi:AcrR family transcriptional regulator